MQRIIMTTGEHVISLAIVDDGYDARALVVYQGALRFVLRVRGLFDTWSLITDPKPTSPREQLVFAHYRTYAS